jgi:hypothetical protein
VTVIKGRNVKVEIGATYSAAITVTAVSKANPAVITSAGHGLSEYSAGYFSSVLGMKELDGQAVMVGTPASNTFPTPGLNSTEYRTFTSGQFVPVLTWLTLAEATSFGLMIEPAEQIERTTILDRFARTTFGLLGLQRLRFSIVGQTMPSAAMLAVEAAALAGASLVWRVTYADGSYRIANGEPSFASEDVQQGAVGTGSLDVLVSGFVVKASGPLVVVIPPEPASSDYFDPGDYVDTDYVL